MDVDDDWHTSFASIRATNDRLNDAIATAIRNEEQEDRQLAIINYKLSVMLIDEALATPVGLPEDSDGPPTDNEDWNRTCRLVQELKIKRGELVQRIGQLLAQQADSQPDGEGFSMAIDCSADPLAKRPWTQSELARQIKSSTSAATSQMQLIYVCENVEFFQIRSTGEVTKSEELSELRILCIDGDEEQHLQVFATDSSQIHNINEIRSFPKATFFMQIIPQSLSISASTSSEGLASSPDTHPPPPSAPPSAAAEDRFDNPWIYPLIPDVSPCYFTKFGAFVFPDLHAADTESSIGVVVSEEYEEYLLDVLEAILNTVIHEDARVDDDRRTRRSTASSRSEYVSENIVRGAAYISNGLVFSSRKVGEFMERSTPYLLSKMNRAPADRPAPLSHGVVTGVELAKTATGVAANATGYVAGKVTSATMALGRFLAPHVQAQGTRLLSHTMGYSQEEANDTVSKTPKRNAKALISRKQYIYISNNLNQMISHPSTQMTGALTIAAGAVEGIGTVYSGLEQSAAVLGTSLSNNTVRVIHHKYGAPAGELASGTFDTVGNVINISHNVGMLHPKSLVKKTAKNAAMFQVVPGGAGGRRLPSGFGE